MKKIVVNLSGFSGELRKVISKGVQEHAFKLGYTWLRGTDITIFTEASSLYFSGNGVIYERCWFLKDKDSYEELDAAAFLKLGKDDVVDALPIVKIGNYYYCSATNELVICTEVDADVDTSIDNKYFVGVSVSGASRGADIYCNKTSFIETNVHIMVDI